MREPLNLVVALRPLSSDCLVGNLAFDADLLHLASHPQRRVEQQISRQLRRQLLAKFLALDPEHLEFIHDERGKPYVKHVSLQNLMAVEFSQSHCLDQFAMVMNKQGIAVGVDIEAKCRSIPVQALSQRILTPHELALFAQALDPHGFLLARWTIKEAVLKASGLGIQLNLNELESLALQDKAWLSIDANDEFKQHVITEVGRAYHAHIGHWYYCCFETATHYYTVAWQMPNKLPAVRVLLMPEVSV